MGPVGRGSTLHRRKCKRKAGNLLLLSGKFFFEVLKFFLFIRFEYLEELIRAHKAVRHTAGTELDADIYLMNSFARVHIFLNQKRKKKFVKKNFSFFFVFFVDSKKRVF